MDIQHYIGLPKETEEKQQDQGNMGPVELVLEAIKLLRDPYHIETFAFIQIGVVFPATVIVLLTQFFVYEVVYKLLVQPTVPWPDMWLVMIVYAALSFFGILLAVNLVAAIYFTAGSMYSGKNVSFKEVLQALPGLWKGVGVTVFWGHALYVATALALFLLNNLLNAVVSILILPFPILIFFGFIVATTVFFFVNAILQLACGVTVFECTCGLAAFSKGYALLTNQWCIAFNLLLIIDVPGIILGVTFGYTMMSTLDLGWKVLLGGLVCFTSSLLKHLSCVTYALFYFSSKSCHNENINFGVVENRQFAAGYQSLGSPTSW